MPGLRSVRGQFQRREAQSGMAKATYKDAGVDLEVYRQSMARLPRLLHRTYQPPGDQARWGLCRPVSARFCQRAVRPALRKPRAGIVYRRRGDEAEGGPKAGRPRHGGDRPGGDERQRRPVLRGRAAVFPRLCGDVARRSDAAGTDRRGDFGRLRRSRFGPAGGRNGHHARPLRPGRLRPGRFLRRRGRAVAS